MKTVLLFALLSGVPIAGVLANDAMVEKTDAAAPGKTLRVVLLGASIGKSWNLPELPKRTRSTGFAFEALQAWEYDKSEIVEETLMRPARKFRLTRTYLKGFFEPAPAPADLIVLKECSSYFPGDQDMTKKKRLYQQWVEEVRDRQISVMVATVVPVTRARAERDGMAKQQGIRAFNDWVRAYAKAERLPLLDLEKALRTDDTDRYLRDDYTSGDGSHLNRAAYDVLDRVMLDALCQVDVARPACAPTRAQGSRSTPAA